MSKEQLAMNNEEKRRITMKMQWKFVCLVAVLSAAMLVTMLFTAACGTSADTGAKDDVKTEPLVSLHAGHQKKDGVGLLVFSPDKKYFLTTHVTDARTKAQQYYADGIVKIWDAKNVTIISTIKFSSVYKFQFNEVKWSGRRISFRYSYQIPYPPKAMAFVDTYDAVTGKLISSKKTDNYENNINPNDLIMNMGNRSDLDRATTLMYKVPENLVAINWSQDGSRIVTANSIRAGTSTCYVWNTATASFDSDSMVDIYFVSSEITSTQFTSTTAHDIHSVAQKSDGTIAVGMWPHNWLQTYKEGKQISNAKTSEGESHRIRKLVYSPNGSQILILGGNRLSDLWEVETTRVKFETIEIFDSDTGGRIRNLVSGSEQNSTDIYYDIAWSPDGTQAAAVSDKSIKVWNALSGALIMSINNPETDNGREIRIIGGKREKAKYIVVTSLAFSPDGKQLVYGDEFGAVSILDIQAKKVMQKFSLGNDEIEIAAVAFSPDSKQVLAVGGGNLKVWDAENGSEIKTLQLTYKSNLTYELNRVVFSPDANRVAYINPDSIIKVHHIPSGKSASLAIYADDEWAACADDGVSFNSNGKGERLISITSGDKVLPRESYESMNNPALLRQILTGKE